MPTFDPELLAEAVAILLYTVVAVVLTAGGIFAEYTSLQQLGAGEATAALWLAAIGAVMLYAGVYALGYRKVLLRLLAAREYGSR